MVLVISLTTVVGSQTFAQPVGDLADVPLAFQKQEQETLGKAEELILETAPLDRPVAGIVMRGVATAAALEGWIRVQKEGVWSDWLPLEIVRVEGQPVFHAGYRSKEALPPGTRIQIRWQYPVGERVTIVEGGAFSVIGEQHPTVTYTVRGNPSGHIRPPHLITRKEWGARTYRGEPTPQPYYEYETFHHTAGYGAETYEEAVQSLQAIQRLHQDIRGWDDIGYHFLLDKSGRVYQGRPFADESVPWEQGPPLVIGAHVGGHNTGNIGIAVMGCFHPPEGTYCEDELSPAAIDSLVLLMAFLADAYGVETVNIKGHRDWSSTACPGDNNYRLLPEIRNRVQRVLETGTVKLAEALLEVEPLSTGAVHLRWAFLANYGAVGFRIERVQAVGSTTVFSGAIKETGELTDTVIGAPGPVTYRLIVWDAEGHEQEVARVEINVAAPEADVLTQSYPNPFREWVYFRYFLKQDGVVTLKLFDALGREVATVFKGFQKGGSWYTASYNGAELPQNVYFARITVEGFSDIIFDQSRPLVHIR